MIKQREDNLESKPERIGWIDTAKGIGILFVMLGHCYLDGKFTFWFYACHMALFFFLSGYTFHYSKNWRTFLLKRIKGLVVPYCFFSVTVALFNWSLSVTHSGEYNIMEAFINYVIQIRYTPLWFLTCMFLATIALNVICCVCEEWIGKKNFWYGLMVFSLVFFFVYRKVIGVELLWNCDLIPLALSFMALGRGYRLSNVDQKKQNYIALLVTASIYLMIAWINYRKFNGVDWYSNQYGNPVLFCLGAVLGTLLFVELSKKIYSKYLLYLGANTLLWYGFHRSVIDLIFLVYNKLGISTIKGSYMSFGFAIINVAITIVVLTPVNYIILRWIPQCIGKGGKLPVYFKE